MERLSFGTQKGARAHAGHVRPSPSSLADLLSLRRAILQWAHRLPRPRHCHSRSPHHGRPRPDPFRTRPSPIDLRPQRSAPARRAHFARPPVVPQADASRRSRFTRSQRCSTAASPPSATPAGPRNHSLSPWRKALSRDHGSSSAARRSLRRADTATSTLPEALAPLLGAVEARAMRTVSGESRMACRMC